MGERLAQRDVAIGIVLSLALGFGLLFLHFYTAFATQATALLFGNVLAVDVGTVWTLLALGAVSLAALAVISRPLLFASLQPELAEAKGVSLRGCSVLFLAVVALATAECAQIVGVLLVFTLMVGPAAAAQRLTSRVGAGVLLSAAWRWPRRGSASRWPSTPTGRAASGSRRSAPRSICWRWFWGRCGLDGARGARLPAEVQAAQLVRHRRRRIRPGQAAGHTRAWRAVR